MRRRHLSLLFPLIIFGGTPLLLETRGLSHTYSAGTPFERTAIEHIDLGIDSGEFLGIIGHTGSGKSTLIQHFNALLKPTAGQVLFEGKDVWSDPAFTRALRFQVGLASNVSLAKEVIKTAVSESPCSVPRSGEEYSPVYFMKYTNDGLEMGTTVYYEPTYPTEVARDDINCRVNRAELLQKLLYLLPL